MSERLIHFDMDLWDAYGQSYEVVNDEDAVMLYNYIGKELYLGEISGKHSDVDRTLTRNSFNVLTDNPDKIEIWKDLVGDTIGAFSIIETIRDQLENDYGAEDDE